MEGLVEKLFREPRWASKRIVDIADLDVIREFVRHGLGIGVLSATIAEKQESDRLRLLRELPSFSERIYLIYRGDLQKTQAAKFLRSEIVAAFKNNSSLR